MPQNASPVVGTCIPTAISAWHYVLGSDSSSNRHHCAAQVPPEDDVVTLTEYVLIAVLAVENLLGIGGIIMYVSWRSRQRPKIIHVDDNLEPMFTLPGTSARLVQLECCSSRLDGGDSRPLEALDSRRSSEPRSTCLRRLAFTALVTR
jgi:hypothetical protein